MLMDDDQTVAPTLREIAEAAGVSIASVSKVLNNRGGVGDESRRKIMALAEQFGYQGRNARSLQKAGIGSTTLLVPAEYYSGSHFYEDVIRGALDEAAAQSLKVNVQLLAWDGRQGIAEIDEFLAAAEPSAIIAVGLDDRSAIDRIAGSGVPAVLINGMDRSMRVDSVLPDNWSAGWLATRRLLEAGHRDIVHVTLPLRLSMERRMAGFRMALEEAGIPFDADKHVIDLGKLGYLETQAQLATRDALQAGRLDNVTAIFCSMDVVALGVMQALQSHGFSIPADFSVVGLDDVSIAMHSRPPLTTISIGRAELGRRGVELLMKRIANPDETFVRVNMGVRMIERATVGPPRQRS
jgi:DNA-binding LacI/PurR family transcriptional regulator